MKKITEIKKRLKLATASETEQTAQQLSVKLSDLQDRTAKIQDIEAGYHRLLTALKKGDSLEKEEGLLREKMPGDEWQKFANLRLLFGYMYAQPGKKLLFMGGEFAQWQEWNHDEGLH